MAGRFPTAIFGRSASKRARLSAAAVAFFLLVSLTADFLANEMPLLARKGGRWICPPVHAFLVDRGWARWYEPFMDRDWSAAKLDGSLRAPIPYGPSSQDLSLANRPPFSRPPGKSLRWTHWLGTDPLGRDVAACLVHGTRNAFAVGGLSVLWAAAIGIALGGLAGFWGDRSVRVSVGLATGLGMSIPAAIFHTCYVPALRGETVGWSGVFMGLSCAFLTAFFLEKALSFFSFFSKKINLPMDGAVGGLIQISVALPGLLVVAVVAAGSEKGSVGLLGAAIGLLTWPAVARLVRAELLRVREMDYLTAARALGYSRTRLFLRHALPNAVAPALVFLAFAFAAAVSVEASLSFFQLGLPPETVTWGRMLHLGYDHRGDWWLSVFPALGLMATLASFFGLGEAMRKR
jgi:peptide/nickel transport system permease protein